MNGNDSSDSTFTSGELARTVDDFNESLDEFNSVLDQFGHQNLCVPLYLAIGAVSQARVVATLCERFSRCEHVMNYIERTGEEDVETSLLPHYRVLQQLVADIC
jgi:hypothetical protein